jgi:TRAP-type C4-dicarboxylate transport system substrate-binding protein
MKTWMPTIIIGLILALTLTLTLSAAPVWAKKAQKVKFVIVGVNEGGAEVAAEPMAINMFIGALDYRMRTYHVLKGKYELQYLSTLFSSANECLTGVASGAAEMTFSGPHYLEQIEPAWKVGESPGVFDSWDHFIRTMNTPAWKELQEKMAKEKGVRIVKWMANIGSFYLYSSKGPITSIKDLKGQKIRYPGGEGYSKAIKAMGATAISLPYTEVVTGLQTNMIDGLLTDMLAAIYFYELPRYTKYAVMVPWGIQPICMVVNAPWWDGLPEDERQAMQDVFDRIDVSHYFEGAQQAIIGGWASDPNTELVELNPEQKSKMHDLMIEASAGVLDGVDPKLVEAIEASR